MESKIKKAQEGPRAVVERGSNLTKGHRIIAGVVGLLLATGVAGCATNESHGKLASMEQQQGISLAYDVVNNPEVHEDDFFGFTIDPTSVHQVESDAGRDGSYGHGDFLQLDAEATFTRGVVFESDLPGIVDHTYIGDARVDTFFELSWGAEIASRSEMPDGRVVPNRSVGLKGDEATVISANSDNFRGKKTISIPVNPAIQGDRTIVLGSDVEVLVRDGADPDSMNRSVASSDGVEFKRDRVEIDINVSGETVTVKSVRNLSEE